MASQVAANAALITEQHALLSRTRGGRLTVQTGFAVVGQASVARVACFLFVGFDEVGQVAFVAILAVAVPIVSLLGHVRSDSARQLVSTDSAVATTDGRRSRSPQTEYLRPSFSFSAPSFKFGWRTCDEASGFSGGFAVCEVFLK